MRTVVLENEHLRATFLPDKGADLVELFDKARGIDLAWRSPMGRRSAVPGGAPDPVAAFLDTYPGGWQEVLPNGGAPCHYRGAALSQHGEVSGVPWAYQLVDEGVIFTVETARFPLRLTKTIRLRGAGLEFAEELENLAPVEIETMWGQHITFGEPFLAPGHRIRLPEDVTVIPHETAIHPAGRRVLPDRGTWPVVAAFPEGTTDLSIVPERGGPSDIVYLHGASWYEITAPDGHGLRVEWDVAVLPYLWLWQELGATTDYPWWGRAYVLGLEPFSSYPTDGLAEAVRNGTALRLAPFDKRALRWSAQLLAASGGADV
ncbi:DUF4432 family protein [Hamadaea sp. NPDC051192]|uniref:DUF4432 family protein n=1 Tax=Hamadaea sp. NPDC051192 TaxID=3154940 RepID=UPI0034333114